MRKLALRLICAWFAIASAAADIAAPPGGSDLALASELKAYADPACGTVSKIDNGGWKVVITKPDEAKAYAAQVALDCPAEALAPGETVLALVKARATQGKASIEAKLQLGKAPYTPAAATTGLELSSTFQELPVLFTITAEIPQGGAVLTFLCAGKAQSVEIQSARVFRYPAGTDISKFPRIRRSYAGREPDAPWRKAALDRIEKQRKSDFSVRVTGPDGKPLANARITLKLRRHEFGFGSAVTADLLTADTEDARRYREIVDRLFSQIVFENDLKDFGWEPEAEGKEEHKQKLDRAFTWLAERNISIRGHYLMQVAVPPNLAGQTDVAAIRKHVLGTMEERLAFAGNRVVEWDVINHPVAWSGAELLTKIPGLETIDREVYAAARSRSPLPFFVNEDQIFRPGRQADETYNYLAAFKRDGLRIDGLGNQSHFDESFLPSPEELLATTDRFAAVVPRQAVTEYDIVTQADEDLAADYTRDALIACFSHPAYSSFLLWGFWEGSHWKAEAASWNRDWSIRKRGEVLEEWLGRRWATEVTLTTDKDGTARWRGFPGYYELRTEASGAPLVFRVSKVTPEAKLDLP
ncbi:endo-1,4-beta-xylanase [Haloferula sp. BvORR071]|uniref:endo-1,4-beta-xylanase n=1 Tax=Haloferula sp. BvORR071 TaxID=1396141 RepID=UPI00054D9D34|nr:endo-1,4-beta-xylanase [Haloferula sp. BvORR071]